MSITEATGSGGTADPFWESRDPGIGRRRPWDKAGVPEQRLGDIVEGS